MPFLTAAKMGIMNRMTPEFRVRSEMQGAIFDGGQNKLGTPFESLHSKQQQNTNTGYIATIKKKITHHPAVVSHKKIELLLAHRSPSSANGLRNTLLQELLFQLLVYIHIIYIYIFPPPCKYQLPFLMARFSLNDQVSRSTAGRKKQILQKNST